MQIADCNAVVPRNVARIIHEKGIKQYVVAKRAKLTGQGLCDMLNGRKLIKPADIIALAYALDVTPNELFETDQTA